MPRAWLLLLIAFVFAGCMPAETHFGGERPANLPRDVISLSPSTTEIVALEGVMSQLKGRTASCDYPIGVSKVPVYAGVKPDYEKLAQAHPDLVVFDRVLYSDADVDKLKQVVGADKIFMFQSNTLDGFESELRQLGGRIDQPINMSQYIDKINAERATAKANAPAKAPKTAVLAGSSMIDGTKSFLADVVRACGGEPVGPDVDRFVVLNPESLIQLNPDVILLSVDLGNLTQDVTYNKPKIDSLMKTTAEKFLADPRFKSVAAVAGGHVYAFAANVVLRKGNRVDLLIHNVSAAINLAGGK